ncbi:MAG TPA: hypothetical protein VEK86_14085 [Gemmatimonadales bacterium]|nr:hypothetical protein [Gemmatimonadales bacterium]
MLADSPECHACGSRGTFEGWRLGIWEAMRLYYHGFGLNPIGPHRPLADQVFAPMRSPCVRCGGRAVLSRDGGAWSRCPACEGTGGVWNRPFHEVDAAWRRVVAQWPDAGVPWVDLRAPARRSARRRGARNAAQDAISSDGVPRAAGMESSRPSAFYRRRGYSAHGLKFADVQRAFAEAEQLLGTEWRRKGRGHCRRVSLDARYSTHAAKGAERSWAWVSVGGSLSPRRLLPLAIVRQAAKILGVPARVLVAREF